MTFERERRIEQLLREEFEADGYTVTNEGGELFALVEVKVGDRGIEHDRINLSRLAAAIVARLP